MKSVSTKSQTCLAGPLICSVALQICSTELHIFLCRSTRPMWGFRFFCGDKQRFRGAQKWSHGASNVFAELQTRSVALLISSVELRIGFTVFSCAHVELRRYLAELQNLSIESRAYSVFLWIWYFLYLIPISLQWALLCWRGVHGTLQETSNSKVALRDVNLLRKCLV